MSKKNKIIILCCALVIGVAVLSVVGFILFDKKEKPTLTSTQKVPHLTEVEDVIQSDVEGEYKYNLSKKEVEALYQGITMVDVPHIFIENFPADLDATNVDDQTLFIKIMTAHILRANQKVVAERKVVFQLLNKIETNQQLTSNEMKKFQFLVKKYDVEHLNTDFAKIKELVERVDVIPVSAGVAHAIWATNWGTKMQKSPFLESAWNDKVSYEPIEFDSLSKATDSFVLELNRRSELVRFRAMRKNTRVFIYSDTFGFYILPELTNYLPNISSYTEELRLVYSLGYIQELDNACFKDACHLTK